MKFKIRINSDDGENLETLSIRFYGGLGRVINLSMHDVSGATYAAYQRLFDLCSAPSAGTPSKKFQKDSTDLIQKIGRADFLPRWKRWIKYLTEKDFDDRDYGIFVSEKAENLAKGLIWSILPFIDQEGLTLLTALSVRCHKVEIKGWMPTSTDLGNACIHIMGQGGQQALTQLNQLHTLVRNKTVQRSLNKQFEAVAKTQNISVEDVKDLSIPDYDFKDEQRIFTFGDYHAVLSINENRRAEIKWHKSDGTVLKSVPAAIKERFADSIKEMTVIKASVQKTLTAKKDELDQNYTQMRVLGYAHFMRYYIQHNLIRILAKRLIWSFELGQRKADGFWWNGQWVGLDDVPITWINDQTTVRLWHPIHKTMKQVLAWRYFMLRKQIWQPFKQAFREIYVLTDAERNTNTYSNRMAAHILRQMQVWALAKARGWKYNPYDHVGIAEKEYRKHNLRVQYWADFIDSGNQDRYISTDQVRFCTLESNDPLPLEGIPALIFSEAMRDVDLFVGVASIGNDPNWRDNGGLPRYWAYWQSYSFGDLSETAKTRKEALERLVPRLKIASQCSFQGNFLKIKGTLRSYKIHIGSGNILMDPNDQYLCIVPDRKELSAEQVFLPFEGDNILSIILSKAFLLADDTTITDETILSQIKK
jgi:hypothetical protein